MVERPSFAFVDPRSADAQEALTRYLSAFLTDPTEELQAVDGYVPPKGRFLVVRDAEGVRGCGALRTIGPSLGEIKRMWVAPEARRQGLGAQVLTILETEARAMGITTLRLDTHETLRAAIHLYESRGYEPIDRYNENEYSTNFYEKSLDAS